MHDQALPNENGQTNFGTNAVTNRSVEFIYYCNGHVVIAFRESFLSEAGIGVVISAPKGDEGGDRVRPSVNAYRAMLLSKQADERAKGGRGGRHGDVN